jgi:hypothetical protein
MNKYIHYSDFLKYNSSVKLVSNNYGVVCKTCKIIYCQSCYSNTTCEICKSKLSQPMILKCNLH